MSEELKPCPFCGGKAKIYGKLLPEISCTECSISTEMFAEEEIAIKAWNTRPEEDRLKAENERLKEALKQIAHLREINPNVRATSFSSCAEDCFCNLYCTMGDIAINALSNAPDMITTQKGTPQCQE